MSAFIHAEHVLPNKKSAIYWKEDVLTDHPQCNLLNLSQIVGSDYLGLYVEHLKAGANPKYVCTGHKETYRYNDRK